MEHQSLILMVVLFSMALSFFFSGMEAGVFALSRLRIRQLMRAGQPRAKVLYGYLERPENFLWTILVGNTLANFVAVGLMVLVLHLWLGQKPVLFLAAFLTIVFLFYATCDLLPKILFRTFPNRLCMALVGPFRFIHGGLTPIVSALAWLSERVLRWTGGKAFTGRLFGNRDELRMMMQESAREFTSEEQTMINRVLDLQTLTVGQITIALEKAVTVTTRTPMTEVLARARERRLTRYPVWQAEDSRRRVVGVVSLKTLLYQADFHATKTAGDYVKPALYLDAEMRLEEALRRMQRSGQRLAIVLGRDRREAGIVSLQDILQVIFGEVNL